MGLLYFLLRLPYYILHIVWEACLYFLQFILICLHAILWLFSPIIGEVKWSIPNWYPKAQKNYCIVGKQIAKYKTFIGSSIILAFAGYHSFNYAYHWYLNRPKPIEVAPIIDNVYNIKFDKPIYSGNVPNINDDLDSFGNMLEIRFTGHPRSPAPLALIGKTINEGISISPKIKGTWIWYNDKTIRFKPEEYWPLATNYKVELDDTKLFAEHNKLDEQAKSFSFETQDFSYDIFNEELYQDPLKPDVKMGIYSVQFSHPVNKKLFEKSLSLDLYQNNNVGHHDGIFIRTESFTVTYDQNDTRAFIKSTPLTLPEKDSYLLLGIEKGFASTQGGNDTTWIKRSKIDVPNRYDLVVRNFDVSLVEANDNEIRQILTVNFNHNIKPADLTKLIKVWQLPNIKNKSWTERYYDQLDKTYKTKIYVSESDLASSKRLPLKLIETDEKPYQEQVSYEFKADQDSKIYIHIDQPLISDGGYYLVNKFHGVEKIPMYPSILNFAAQGSLLSLSGDKKLPVVSRNYEKIKLEIDRVIPSQLQHLVAFNENNFQSMNFGWLDSDHFTEKYSVQKTIKNSPQSITYTDFDLSQFLKKDVKGKENRGVFLVRLYGKNHDTKSENYKIIASRFIMVTDMGIINKKSLDQSQDIFVQSIHSGQPISNAKVSVLGVNGIEITSVQTDENGHAHFAPLSDYYKGIKPLLFAVEKDQDLSFLPIVAYDRDLNFSRFDIGGIYETLDGGMLRSHLFSDRGIYRPGDTFHIGTIVRAQNWEKSLKGIRLEADIYDAQSNLVTTEQIRLDNFGFNEFSYQTDYSSPTGEWYINLYLKNNNKDDDRTLLGSTSIFVRDFEPDKTAVSLKLHPDTSDGWVNPNELYATVEATNLFGTPAQDRLVSSKLFLEPSAPYFKKYDDYNFYQNIATSRNDFNVPIEDTYTDEKGIAKIELPIDSFEGQYTARVLTDVFEPDSGRSVAATANIYVSSAEYLIGAKTDGSLGYIKLDSKRLLNLIAINPKLEKIKLDDIKLVKYEKKYLSVLVKQPSGVYKYQSRLKNIVISETDFSIDNTGTTYQIDTQTPGNYILQLKDKNDNIIYQTEYFVAGSSNVSRSLERNAELLLKIDKQQYNPGEEIEVSITAPYAGSGIITIERDKVYSWKWFTTTTTNSVQKITLPEDVDGNAYINVQFIRDPSSDEIFMSPLSYGVVPFKVSNVKFKENIRLKAPNKIKPGETIPITLTTNTKQHVVVFAVDEGILQVSGYKLSNPLNSFIRKKSLSVRTSQILDLILPEFSRILNLSAPGGDDQSSRLALDSHLNPFKRKTDEPVVYWSGIMEVEGSKTVKYKVPDYFNGKIRIMAVSVGRKTMDSAQTSTIVRNDFVLNPNAPYFVAPNDEFELSLLVANNITELDDKSIPVKVSLTTTGGLQVLDSDTKTINLASMQEGSLKFKLKATDKLGNADLKFTASYKKTEVKRNVSLSVRPISPYRLQTVMGRMDGSKEIIPNKRELYQPFSEIKAAVSYSPLVLAKGLTTYLDDYPYYCSEQIVSRAIPLLIGSKYPDFDLITNKTINFNDVFQTLRTRQNNDGAIGLWYPTYNVDPFITLYTVHFLLEAKEAGQVVPEKMLQQANKYVKQIAAMDSVNEAGFQWRAYAIYLLTRQNEVTTSYLASLMADLKYYSQVKLKTSNIISLYLASSYKMLKMDKEAKALLKPILKDLDRAYTNAWWNVNYYDPLVVNAQIIYFINKHFPESAKDIPAQALENMVIMLNQDRYNTQSSAMTLLALDSYTTNIEREKLTENNLTISSQTDQQNKLETIAKLKNILAKGKLNITDKAVIFDNATKYSAWYLFASQGYDKTVQLQPITKGLEIYREFVDDQGKLINKVKLGDTINVIIKVRTLSKEGATNLAIVDLLPGGFEVVQQKPHLKQGDETDENQNEGEDYYEEGDERWISPIAVGDYTWYPDYTDIREDRVIIYGSTASDEVQTFKYQIKATNVGQYAVPPAYGESMYDRDIQAVSKGGDTMTIENK